MKRFIQGEHRGQSTLLPESLDDYVADTNPVRVVDVFVDELDLGSLGFDGVVPAETGRPAYYPSVLLKIYIYGYLIEVRNGVYWIENPSDPRENFADKWEETPEKRHAFYDWLETARADFDAAARATSSESFADALAPRMGRAMVERAASKQSTAESIPGKAPTAKESISSKLRRILDAPHRGPIGWRELAQGVVRVTSMTVSHNGFRPYEVGNDGAALPKQASLAFHASTNIPFPYKVFWQVVNTGNNAQRQRGLRGGFDEGIVQSGRLERRETTSYSGNHSIECFIVKDGYCIARSGPFIVNIR